MVEITSYVLGMLTIAAILLLIALVLGMVKISKLEKKISEQQNQIDGIHQFSSHEHEYFQRLFEDTHRDINMVEKTFDNKTDKLYYWLFDNKTDKPKTTSYINYSNVFNS